MKLEFDQPLQVILQECLKNAQEEITSYKQATCFRTAFRLSLEKQIQLVHFLKPVWATSTIPELKCKFEDILSQYSSATNGRTLICIHNRTDENPDTNNIEHQTLRLVSKENGEQWIFPLSTLDSEEVKTLQDIRDKLKRQSLEDDVKSGKIILHLHETNNEEEMKDLVTKYWYEYKTYLSIFTDYWHLRVKVDKLLNYWPYHDDSQSSDDGEDIFEAYKNIIGQYGQYIYFSSVRGYCEQYPTYLEYLILEYGVQHPDQITRSIDAPSLDMIKLYHKAYLKMGKSNQQFAERVITGCEINESKITRNHLQSIFKYLWPLLNIVQLPPLYCDNNNNDNTSTTNVNNTHVYHHVNFETAVSNWLKSKHLYYSVGNMYALFTQLFCIGAFRWDMKRLTNEIIAYNIKNGLTQNQSQQDKDYLSAERLMIQMCIETNFGQDLHRNSAQVILKIFKKNGFAEGIQFIQPSISKKRRRIDENVDE